MERRRRLLLCMVLLSEITGLILTTYALSADKLYTQQLVLSRDANITCAGNSTCRGEITLGLFTGNRALDSGLGIKGREQYFSLLKSLMWYPEVVLWMIAVVSLAATFSSMMLAVILTVINIAMIPIETRHGPRAIWIANFLAGLGVCLTVIALSAMVHILLDKEFYLSTNEIKNGWEGESKSPQIYLWFTLTGTVPLYLAATVTRLAIERECSLRCTRSPRSFTGDTFQSTEMILY